jgi:signal transduction histidine kinase
MQQRLARLDNPRKEFIANASHERRTPIFSLGGFVELLDEDEPDPAVRAEFVRTMREQVARLTKLAADLLDLSKLDADALQVNAERVDLGDLARRTAEEFWPVAERHRSPIESTPTGSRGPGRLRSSGADHAYPGPQCAHAHAAGNVHRDRSSASGRNRETGGLR